MVPLDEQAFRLDMNLIERVGNDAREAVNNGRLAAPMATDLHHFGRAVDLPVHIGVEKFRDAPRIARLIGRVKRLDHHARHGIAHSDTRSPMSGTRLSGTVSGWPMTCSTASKLSSSDRFSISLPSRKRKKLATRKLMTRPSMARRADWRVSVATWSPSISV